MTFVHQSHVVTLDGLPGDHIYESIVKRQMFYEDRMLDYIASTITHFDGIIDVGANIGNHTVFFGLFTDATHIHAFEPNHMAWPFLDRNVEHNGLHDKVTVHRCAVGAMPGFVGVTTSDPHNLGSTAITTFGTIPMVTLNDMTRNGWMPTTLLKIDVEGYEMNVLAGATEILKQHPHIFIEAQTAEQKAEIDAFLGLYGYAPARQVFNWTPTYHYY